MLVTAAVTCALAAPLALAPNDANALATIEVGENQNINFFILGRTSFRSIEDGAPNGSDDSSDFTLENMRLYMWGQAGKDFIWQLDLDKTGDSDKGSAFGAGTGGEVRILDGYVGWQPSNWFNVWAGRLLPVNSRTVLAAPLLSATFDFPNAWWYPTSFQGRDEGMAFWGHDAEGKFKYRLTVTEGVEGNATQTDAGGNVIARGGDDEDNLLWTGRINYNFFDGEPGFYPFAFYSGSKRIVSWGVSFAYEEDVVGVVGDKGDFTSWSTDLRVDWPLANGGVLDFEAAYFDYDLDDAGQNDGVPGDPSLLAQGESWYVTAAYLLPGKFGIGRLEPRVVYEEWDADSGYGIFPAESGLFVNEYEKLDIGFRYILSKDSHNIRLELYYSDVENELVAGGSDDFDMYTARVYFAW